MRARQYFAVIKSISYVLKSRSVSGKDPNEGSELEVPLRMKQAAKLMNGEIHILNQSPRHR